MLQKQFSIVFPNGVGIPIFMLMYANGQRRTLALKEAKDIVFSAVLRGDMVFSEEGETDGVIGAMITVIDKAEVERAKRQHADK